MKLLILFIFLSVYTVSALAQGDDKVSEKDGCKFGIAILPQYAIASTMRLDLDITLKNNNVLTLSPMFSFARNSSLLFSNSSDSYYYDYQDEEPQNISLTGAGFKAMVRHFFGSFENNTGAYAGAGLHYRFSHLEYQEMDWVAGALDGVPTYRYGLGEQSQNINQGGIDILFGYQMYMVDNLFFDLYAGWGFRLSDFDADNREDDYWGETIFDHGYSGYTPLLGLRLGFFF